GSRPMTSVGHWLLAHSFPVLISLCAIALVLVLVGIPSGFLQSRAIIRPADMMWVPVPNDPVGKGVVISAGGTVQPSTSFKLEPFRRGDLLTSVAVPRLDELNERITTDYLVRGEPIPTSAIDAYAQVLVP